MRPQGGRVPTSFHRNSSALAHPTFEPGEKAFEFAQAACQEVMQVARLWDPRSKFTILVIRIALDDRDSVDEVAQNAGSTHACEATADYYCTSSWQCVASTNS